MEKKKKKRVIILHPPVFGMQAPTIEEEGKRTMPICFTPDQLKVVEEYAKKRGMLNASQAIEELSMATN